MMGGWMSLIAGAKAVSAPNIGPKKKNPYQSTPIKDCPETVAFCSEREAGQLTLGACSGLCCSSVCRVCMLLGLRAFDSSLKITSFTMVPRLSLCAFRSSLGCVCVCWGGSNRSKRYIQNVIYGWAWRGVSEYS